jgi:hypothetical protein
MDAEHIACVLLVDYSEVASCKRRQAMAKRKNENPKRSPSKGEEVPPSLYAKMRKKFSAADLQKYTEIDEGVPAEVVLAEMKEIHRKYGRKRG